jgi:predicted O-methyltransferase YrrM
MFKYLQKYLPKGKVKPFHTYRLGFLIYSLILNSDIKSYLEIGYGFGYTILMAGLGLKDSRGENGYFLTGLDIKTHRRNTAVSLFQEYGINGELLIADATQYPWDKYVDAIFFDSGHRTNQLMIDKYGKYANKLIIVHDVDRELKFPKGFMVYKFDQSIIAFRNNTKL